MTLLALMASFETAFAQPHAPSERSVPDARIDGVLGGFYDWAGDWNLERARTDNPNCWATVAFHLCNW